MEVESLCNGIFFIFTLLKTPHVSGGKTCRFKAGSVCLFWFIYVLNYDFFKAFYAFLVLFTKEKSIKNCRLKKKVLTGFCDED